MKQVERKRFGSLIAFGIFSTGLFAPVLIAHQPVDCSERKSRAREGGSLGWLRLAKVEDDKFARDREERDQHDRAVRDPP